MSRTKHVPTTTVTMLVVLLLGAWRIQATEVTGWHYMEQTRIAWRPYGEATFAEARRAGKPLFVLVFADWCEWCRKYEVETLETDAIRDRLGRDYIPVAVDYATQPALAKELGAKLVPTTLLLVPEGEKLLRFHGVQAAADLADTLDRTLALWKQGETPQPDYGDIDTCCPLEDGTGDKR